LTLLEQLADWIVRLRRDDVPDRVHEAARIQLRSVLASIYPGAESAAARACRSAALALGTRGRASVLPDGESASPVVAVLANAALSMTHDFDDYLFLGHIGHSAVLAALAVAEEEEADLESMLLAQVAANEIAGRLGAYVAIGPQNGQLWAHVHLAAAVAAAARLRGLDAERTADALSIAFYQPHFTLFAGFMASEAKVLTAAQPAATGLYAVDLAARGMRGAREILEHPRGFARQFAFVPFPEVLGGLGQAWVSDTLSCKIYPGCAYIDAPVDAALAARGERSLAARDIASVDILASALTSGMEAIVEESAPTTSLDPIAINFSARRSVAIALLAGSLTPRELGGPWLEAHADEVRALAEATSVRPSGAQTLEMLEGIGRALPMLGVVRTVGFRRLWRARQRVLGDYGAAFSRGGSAHRKRRWLPTRESLELVGALIRGARGGRRDFDMNGVDFRRLEFRFGSEVRIRLRDGSTLEARRSIPRGAAGGGPDEMRALVIDKLRAEAAAAGTRERADAIEEILSRPAGDTPARDLARAAAGDLHAVA
jgi:2-methylcitrate dehydratase PrpD